MNYLIAGGTGFLGSALSSALRAEGHSVTILTRRPWAVPSPARGLVKWDGRTLAGWASLLNEIDVVINLAGKSVSSWPWTVRTKREFLNSRVQPGHALAQAIEMASSRPRVLVQASGINHYGLRGEAADERSPAGTDFLAQLTVKWEASTQQVEHLGVRRIIVRSAVVLGTGGMLPLMALPARLFGGGPIAGGSQAMPWIHLTDWIGAVRFLIDHAIASGPFNLIAPETTSNAQFNRQLADALHRPYWLPVPAFMLRVLLGELSVIVLEGRFARPQRLLGLGFPFRFARLSDALANLYV
jgi:hypothetical protein